MSRETRWSDDARRRPQETVFAGQSPADVKAAENAVAHEWQVGDTILDLYEVKQVFTGGAMGLVYRVHHRNWSTELVVKTPRRMKFDDRSKEERFYENFRTEAETWVNLGLHPHTVSCYYVRNLGGLPRVFAEFVEGGSLEEWIRDRRLYEGGREKALERILGISIQFAWGLQYAHERGLVHQDVKPANVMMSPEGAAKVTDFGLAKAGGIGEGPRAAVAGGSVLVESGGLTPAYCSPEQAAGRALSRKTDIWSWAVSVLEMFTGEVSWMSGEVAADALEAYLEYAADDEQIPQMPEALASTLIRCFQRTPAERPRDMMEAASELQDIYRKVTGQAYPRHVPKPVEAVADSLNNRAVSLLDLGKRREAIELWNEALKVDPRHAISIFNRGLALWRDAIIDDEELLVSLAKASQEGWLINYLFALTHAERGDYVAALDRLDKISSDETLPDVASLRDDAQKLLSLSTRLVETYDLPAKYICSLSSGGDGWYALSKNKRLFKVWEISSGKLICEFPRADYYEVGWLSPGGRYVMSGGGNRWKIENGAASVDEPESKDTSLSPDGRYKASYGHNDKRLRLLELKTGRCLITFEAHDQPIGAIFWDTDKGCVLTGGEDKRVKIWHANIEYRYHSPFVISRVVESETIIKNEMEFDSNLAAAKTSFEAQQFAAAAEQLRSARSIHNFRNHPEAFALWAKLYYKLPRRSLLGAWKRTLFEKPSYPSVLTPDAKYQIKKEEGESIIIRALPTGEQVNSIKAWHSSTSQLAVSRDGRFFCTVSESSIALWEVETGRCIQTFSGHNAPTNAISISADNRHILSGSHDGKLKLWDVRAGVCLRTFEGHTSHVVTAVLSSDGHYALSGAYDRKVKLWDVATGLCVRTFEGHYKMLNAVALSPDDSLAFSASYDNNHGIKVWDVRAGECRFTYLGHKNVVQHIFISPDGKYVLSGAGFEPLFRLWDVRTGQDVYTFEGRLVGVSDDWGRIFSSTDGHYTNLQVWHLDWELEAQDAADWDEGARTYLQTFITLHTPFAVNLPVNHEPTEEEIRLALTRRGTPEWDGDDFRGLLDTLGLAGYGWLRPEGVRRELEKMTARWSSSEPPSVAGTHALETAPEYESSAPAPGGPVRCHVCAGLIAAGEKYCPVCGATTRLSKAAGEAVTPVGDSVRGGRVSCPSCKSIQPDAAVYCEVCGARLGRK
jgi:WD40 repeat protein/serine/threonine protein kinase